MPMPEIGMRLLAVYDRKDSKKTGFETTTIELDESAKLEIHSRDSWKRPVLLPNGHIQEFSWNAAVHIYKGGRVIERKLLHQNPSKIRVLTWEEQQNLRGFNGWGERQFQVISGKENGETQIVETAVSKIQQRYLQEQNEKERRRRITNVKDY
jgi:hypothetical protein